jgi:hypothetical protein
MSNLAKLSIISIDTEIRVALFTLMPLTETALVSPPPNTGSTRELSKKPIGAGTEDIDTDATVVDTELADIEDVTTGEDLMEGVTAIEDTLTVVGDIAAVTEEVDQAGVVEDHDC